MNRRKFIGQTGKYIAATAIPFILPSGRLFAATEAPLIKHVVFCLFAGGIRRWESIDFKDGNLMPNTLNGDASISQDILPGIHIMPRILDTPLQNYGTLLKGFKYKSTFTHHYPAHATSVSGKYYYTNEMFQPIQYPSVFEYFRKHSGYGKEALKTWWVADKPGDFPFIQYSKNPNYGWQYAANMIQPTTLFKFNFAAPFENERNIELREMVNLINKDLNTQIKQTTAQLPLNTPEEKQLLQAFIQETYANNFSNKIRLWDDLDSELMSRDMTTMFTACEILKTFHPHLLVVNMQDSDIGHFDFTGYCDHMHRADYALGKLWKTIQEDPVLKDNTILVAQPEFGRNENSNTVSDSYGRFAVDHNGDEVSQQNFCLIVGPPNIIQQNKVVVEEYGEVIDTVPTIAHLLGFYESIPSSFLTGKILYEALV